MEAEPVSAGLVDRDAGRVIVEHPVFVTPHARRRWRERINPRATDAEIEQEILTALQNPLRLWREGKPTDSFLVRTHPLAMARLAPSDPAKGPWPVVTTVVTGGTMDRVLRQGRGEVRAEPAPALPLPPKPRRGRAPLPLDEAELTRLYVAEKLSTRELAERFGVCPRTIRQRLAAANIARRLHTTLTAKRRASRERQRARGSARRQAVVDFLGRYAGYRTVAWMAERLHLTPRTVQNYLWTEGIAPTTRDDLLTSGLAAELLGCSQQWVTTLIRRGILRAHRYPGGRWWLIPREDIQRMLDAAGKTSADPLLTRPLAWPRAVVAKRRRCG